MAKSFKHNPGSNHANRFEQLGTVLPTPTEYGPRTGAKILQQKWDYDIKRTLDETN